MASSPSPLTQDARLTLQPKIVSLYESLFKDDGTDDDKSEGFWTEFFLLRPHPTGLRAQLDPLSPDDLLHLTPVTCQLFTRSVAALKIGRDPQDEIALDTLYVFLKSVLSKRWMSASSDVIAVLTGLDNADAVFNKFVAAIDGVVRNGRGVEVRRKAVQVALVLACGAFNTGLLSYFTHRDLFPALMKFINDPQTEDLTYEPFMLLGVLANYNKFELQNPYQLRLDDFVNEATIKRIIHEIGMACIQCRADYVAIQDDLPEGWSLNSMLSYVGLTILAGAGPKPKTPSAPNGDVSKLSFSTLYVMLSLRSPWCCADVLNDKERPNPRAAILLATYDFVNANMLFCHNFVNYQESDPKVEPPICAYLSFTSYLLHHAHRSTRSSLYARTNLLVLRILLEDQGIYKRMVSDDSKGFVRLCRQKPPHLPMVRGKRVLLTAVIDTVADGINHNLRKKLDTDLYIVCIGVLHRALGFLIRTRTRLEYHWSELWRCILTLLRFLNSYSSELQNLSGLSSLIDDLLNLVVLALTSGDSFLANASEYDDLFYKLVEAGDVLIKFRDSYKLKSSSPITTLIRVSEHYHQLIQENRGRRGKNLTPQQVAEVIKSGYDTLDMGETDKSGWEKYREQDERAFLKRVARMAVVDLGKVGETGGAGWGV